ncbi:MAG: glycosyltransferase family 39 protein, partial [Treponema sp.]|nr:glycosyltransferase family 39 protein [Treponema sp.]
MNKKHKRVIFLFFCILLCCLSQAGIFRINGYRLKPITAQVHVNIEIKKSHSGNLLLKTNPGDIIHVLSPTTEADPSIDTIVMYRELGGPIEELSLMVPKDTAEEILSSIDSISVFIGNSFYYFSPGDIRSFASSSNADSRIYDISKNMEYAPFPFGKRINWYGNLNFLLLFFSAPLMYPWYFWPLYIMLFCIWIFRRGAGLKGREIDRPAKILFLLNKRPWIIPLVITVIAFLLRLNGFDRYSAGGDELSSAEISAPGTPLAVLFSDPGNPPFYYLVLKLMFLLCGYSEAAGRLLSVMAGTALVPCIWILVKKYAGRKAAATAAIFLSFSDYLIRASHNTRAYMLQLMLVTILAVLFLRILKNGKNKDMLLYTCLSVLLVNTHFYGVLFVASNFLFFCIYRMAKKEFTPKETLVFFLFNVITALSLFPYLAHNLRAGEIMNKEFNNWIKPLSARLKLFSCLALLLSGLFYWAIRHFLDKRGCFRHQQKLFLDYMVFICLFVFLEAFLISLIRPILTLRYLSIISVFILSIWAILLNLNTGKLYIKILSMIAAYMLLLGLFHALPRTTFFDVSKEAWQYISADAARHSELSAAVTDRRGGREGYYKYQNIPIYSGEKNIDILYISPVHYVEQEMYDMELKRFGLDGEGIIKIRINRDKAEMKKFLRKPVSDAPA